MKYVITGSNGFIGTALKETLANNGEVRCLVRAGQGKTVDGSVTKYGINYASVDSLVNSGALDDADYVFHVAGVTKQLTLDGFRKGNVMPTQNLLEALTRLKTPLKRFVLISSQAAAGPASSASNAVQESNTPSPIEDYGQSKLEAEQLLTQNDWPFDYTIIRPAAVYGPRDVDFLALFKQLKSGLGIYPANKHSYVSTIYVDDLVAGIIDSSRHTSAQNQTYFLTNEVAISWQEIYQIISALWERKLLEINLPFPLISFAGKMGDLYSRTTGRITVMNSKKIELAKPKYWVCSSQKARTDFGFQPMMGLTKGLFETFKWYKKAGWL